MVKIHAPASIGNISVGFDVLGIAISPIDGTLLGDSVSIDTADKFVLHNIGQFANKLPYDIKDNIVYQCWKIFCKTINKQIPVAITLEKNMPISSGLGSSASSIVAGLVAMNDYCHKPLHYNELLILMGKLEGYISGSVHYDNVAPCFLGGMQLILEENGIISQQVPMFKEWLWVIAYPGIKVSTAESRAILPELYLKDDIIRHGRYLAGVIHACHMQQPDLAAKMMQDVIAEPYRKNLLPGFAEARKAAFNIGALVFGISGSGPTVFAVCDKLNTAKYVAEWLHQHYLQNDEGFVYICRLDTVGARKIG